jgi:hypothetical protein
MFATLVVGLPSRHLGGELIIRFDGEQEVVDFSASASNYRIPFAAFYADCDHQIKPVTSGYRICLVYNLIQDKGKEQTKVEPLKGQVNKIATLLRTRESSPFSKIVLLGHQYTPSNFSMDSLKLNDRAKAVTLMRAAGKADYYAKLCLVTSYQSGELQVEYRRTSRRWGYYGDFDDGEDLKNATMGEVYDDYVHIEHWMEGGVPPLRRIGVEEDTLISPISLNKGEPVEKEAEGYTGNAGMTMRYWYHYGAIVLWPKEQHLSVLAGLSAGNQLEWIDYYNKRWDLLEVEEKETARGLVERGFSQLRGNEENNFAPLADLLIKLKDEEYLREKASLSLTDHFSRIPVENWVDLFEAYPPACFEDVFASVGTRGHFPDASHLIAILRKLSDSNKPYFHEFVVTQMMQLPSRIRGVDLASRKKEAAAGILDDVLQIADKEIKNNADWVQRATEAFVCNNSREYVNALIQTMLALGRKTALAEKLMVACKHELKTRVENKPTPPADWSRPVPDSNLYREEWRLLARFLQSPTEQVFDYRELKTKRADMASAINSVTIDLKMETIRKGSPHILRLTKTQDAYQSEVSRWRDDVRLLARIEEFDGAGI